MAGRTVIVKNVPDNKVAEVIGGFRAEGAEVTVEREPDGEWTVIAIFPADPTPEAAAIVRAAIESEVSISARDVPGPPPSDS